MGTENGIKKILHTVFDPPINYKRKNYYQKHRKELVNQTPSIITNNCIAGKMYHNLGLKFNSPTINLYFDDVDFLKFVDNLEYYAKCEPVQVFKEGISCPVGLLKCKDEEIIVYFLHFNSFEEAKEKWLERGNRIDYNNIYIIFEVAKNLNDDIIQKFKDFKYVHKKLICGLDIPDDNVVKLDIYDDRYFPGKILSYKSKFSSKTYLDDFDYISFLNQR